MKRMTSLGFAIAVVVGGQVLYHAVARGADPARSAFALVTVAYVVSLVAVVSTGIISQEMPRADFTAPTLFRGAALGLAVALVELGYVYSYRRGLSVATGALSVLTLTTIALLPIGLFVFKESLSPRVLIGAGVAVFGVWLMRTGG